MKLIQIDKNKYEDYRLSVIFDGYKWDPQFLDNNTVADHALVLTQNEHKELKALVETIGKESEEAEIFINNNLSMFKKLKLPRKMKKVADKLKSYDKDKHIRLMRFDFHPTIDNGFMISEVNSDVPGGFAEGSIMPEIALKYIEDAHKYTSVNFKDILVKAIQKKVVKNGKIMLVHCTSYSDDRQVMQFIGDELKKLNYTPIYGAADHLIFKNKKAYSILDNNEGYIDAIIRFNPIEWVVDIKDKAWHGYFDTTTVSNNHPVTVLIQSKRFPLVWDILKRHNINLNTWEKLLPETIEVKDAKNREGFIYKPVWGRVGEGISIKEAIKEDEYKKILKDVKRRPHKYVAQKKFISKPLLDSNNVEQHLSLGVYYVEGKFAGYYARISKNARIDSNAQDIPVLIEKE